MSGRGGVRRLGGRGWRPGIQGSLVIYLNYTLPVRALTPAIIFFMKLHTFYPCTLVGPMFAVNASLISETERMHFHVIEAFNYPIKLYKTGNSSCGLKDLSRNCLLESRLVDPLSSRWLGTVQLVMVTPVSANKKFPRQSPRLLC